MCMDACMHLSKRLSSTSNKQNHSFICMPHGNVCMRQLEHVSMPETREWKSRLQSDQLMRVIVIFSVGRHRRNAAPDFRTVHFAKCTVMGCDKGHSSTEFVHDVNARLFCHYSYWFFQNPQVKPICTCARWYEVAQASGSGTFLGQNS